MRGSYFFYDPAFSCIRRSFINSLTISKRLLSFTLFKDLLNLPLLPHGVFDVYTVGSVYVQTNILIGEQGQSSGWQTCFGPKYPFITVKLRYK